MEHNKTPGPDGFLAEFYQAFWEVINDNLVALFVDFHKCILPSTATTFESLLSYPKKQMQLKFRIIEQYAFLMLVLKYSKR